jgi:hypothetical protein
MIAAMRMHSRELVANDSPAGILACRGGEHSLPAREAGVGDIVGLRASRAMPPREADR